MERNISCYSSVDIITYLSIQCSLSFIFNYQLKEAKQQQSRALLSLQEVVIVKYYTSHILFPYILKEW